MDQDEEELEEEGLTVAVQQINKHNVEFNKEREHSQL